MIEPRSPSFRSYGFTVSLNNFDLSASRFFVEQRIPPCISVTSTETLLPQLFNCPTYTRHVKTPIARFGHKRKKPTPLFPIPQEGRQMPRPGTRNLPNFQLPAVYFTDLAADLVTRITRLIILIQSLLTIYPKILQNRLNYILRGKLTF